MDAAQGLLLRPGWILSNEPRQTSQPASVIALHKRKLEARSAETVLQAAKGFRWPLARKPANFTGKLEYLVAHHVHPDDNVRQGAAPASQLTSKLCHNGDCRILSKTIPASAKAVAEELQVMAALPASRTGRHSQIVLREGPLAASRSFLAQLRHREGSQPDPRRHHYP